MDVSLHDALREAADPTTLMRRVSEQALTLIPGADGASLVIRIDDDTLECVAAVGTMSPHNGLRLRINQSLSGESALTGQLIRSDDVAQDPRVDPAATRRTGVASLLALPLSETSDRVVVLAVTSQRVNAFTPSDDPVLISLAEFVRRALDVAAELARVTTVLLASSHSQEERLQTARFVAEVVRPGLVDDIVGHRRVRDVLETTSMEMVVQPIADMRSGEVRMAEALARFTVAPSRGPDQWFAEAHRVGLGLQLELAAVQGALDLIASLPDSVALTVNVAPVVLASGGLLELVDQTLHPRLVLEITEHHTIDPLSLLGPIERVREAGVRIAIDDTGSGYATLSALLRIKPDIIKLDRDLVRGIDEDPVRRAMARALVQFTREDGPADLVAEGIETQAEATALVDLGVTLGQGYLFGRPMPVSELPETTAWHPERKGRSETS